MAETTVATRWTTEAHEVAELERDAAWHAGYRAGYRAAQDEIRVAAERVATSPHPPHLSPTAEQVVRQLAERLVAEGRPSTPAPVVRYDDEGWPRPARPGSAA